jgi:hypothetical protein
MGKEEGRNANGIRSSVSCMIDEEGRSRMIEKILIHIKEFEI